MNLIFSHFISGQPWPNLASPTCDRRELDNKFPGSIPLRLLYYFNDHNYPYNIYNIHDPYPPNSYYPIGLAFFNFEIDYFDLLDSPVKDHLRQGRLRILFYYHEGDNPARQQVHLDQLCQKNNLPKTCYRFISGNTQADLIDQFVYFPDHELFYQRAIQNNTRIKINNEKRNRDFTLLSRRWQPWRAAFIAELYRTNHLANSYWSFNTVGADNLSVTHDNPVNLFRQFGHLPRYAAEFIQGSPYTCDQLSTDQHNCHQTVVTEHYTNSAINLVLETHFDADDSGGTFLTEKTFKPIAHGQPFVIVGCAGTLAQLQALGYRTFDSRIPSDYDLIRDNTLRFGRLIDMVAELKQQNLAELFESCRNDIEYNQDLFYSNKQTRLSNLETQLND